jgi:endonuclease YncB( thermonuclease family)
MQQEAKMQALRVPSVEYGPVKLPAVGFDELPQDFLDFYRKRAGAETSGLIGANALLNYRVGIDYAHSTVYFDQRGSYISPGIDVVGLTLRPELDGRYTIIGVPDYQGKPAVPEAKAGDVLVAVDKVPAKGSTMGQIWSLLEGEPGETRVLTLEREGKQLTVNATVRRFLPVNPLDFSADPCGSPLVESQLWYSVDGTVVEVEDGSTVLMTLTKGHRRVKVHLVGITVTQDGALANEAKQHISDMVFNKTVGVLINTEWLYEKKRPAEITGVVHVKDGAADVGLSLITKGLARTDEPRPYSMSHYTFCKYREAERKAKSDKMGIWQ